MIKGSREEHMAGNVVTDRIIEETKPTSKDYMLDESLFDDDCYEESEEHTPNEVVPEYDDSTDGWSVKQPTVDELVKQQIMEDKGMSLKKKEESEHFIPELVPKAEDEGKIFLTNHELSQINLNAEKHKVFEKDKKIIDINMKLLQTQEALLDAKKETLEKGRMILEYHAIQLTKDHEEFKGESKQFLVDISNSHESLKGKKWGYHPESGEIIVD